MEYYRMVILYHWLRFKHWCTFRVAALFGMPSVIFDTENRFEMRGIQWRGTLYITEVRRWS